MPAIAHRRKGLLASAHMRLAIAFVVGLAAGGSLAGCGPTGMTGPTMNNRVSAGELATESVVSKDILRREPRVNRAMVKHVLVSWKDKLEGKPGADPRALERGKRDAERLIRDLHSKAKAGTPFEELMATYSEDPGSAASGEAYEVAPDAQLVIEFRQLGLRLDVGEVGIVESDYGFHLMTRVE